MDPGLAIALAFSAGMVATVNPCGFALLPAYLSYFLGVDVNRDTDSVPADESGSRRGLGSSPVMRALAVSASVSAGFMLVFGVMGFAWTSVSGLVGRRLPYFTLVVGIALIGLGIAMLRGFEPVLRTPRLEMGSRSRELSSMFLYGVSYAIASLSCTIPVFVGIVATTLERQSFAVGVATFLSFAAGMAATLSILTVAVALARTGLVRTFRRVLPHMHTISGVLLILAGGFVSYYAWVEIQELGSGRSSWIVDWSRDVQSAMTRWVEQMGSGRLAAASAIIIGAAVVVTVISRSGSRQRRDDR